MGDTLQLILLILIILGLAYCISLTISAEITLDKISKECDNIKKHINEIIKKIKKRDL
jgi:hypothetical protein